VDEVEDEEEDDDDDGKEVGILILMYGMEDVTDIFSLYTNAH
jgi:hypothetical protein